MKKDNAVFIPVAILFAVAGWIALSVIGNAQDIAVLFEKDASVKEYLRRIEGKVDRIHERLNDRLEHR